MALLDCESFGLSTALTDYLNSRAFISVGTGGVFNDANSPFVGDAYVATEHLAEAFIKALPAAVTTLFAGFRLSLNPGAGIAFRDSNGTSCFSVQCNPANNVTILDGSGNVLGTSISGVFPANGWFYLEVGAFISQSAGTCSVRINGAEVLALTGVNTKGGSLGTVQQYGVVAASSNLTCSTAHWYFCDNNGSSPQNSFLGDVRVQCLRPTSNAAVSFTPNGDSANYQNVSMATPNPSTDFNSSTTVGATDTFGFQPVAGGLISIMGVAVKAVASKSDAGLRGFSTTITSGPTTQAGTPVMLGTTLTLAQQIMQDNPNTTGQWTQQAVDALVAGYTITS